MGDDGKLFLIFRLRWILSQIGLRNNSDRKMSSNYKILHLEVLKVTFLPDPQFNEPIIRNSLSIDSTKYCCQFIHEIESLSDFSEFLLFARQRKTFSTVSGRC